jgi:hypothetical protein
VLGYLNKKFCNVNSFFGRTQQFYIAKWDILCNYHFWINWANWNSPLYLLQNLQCTSFAQITLSTERHLCLVRPLEDKDTVMECLSDKHLKRAIRLTALKSLHL